jgi:hypothetical protein
MSKSTNKQKIKTLQEWMNSKHTKHRTTRKKPKPYSYDREQF